MTTAESHRRRGGGISARCGVCTVSDTRTLENDRSGALLKDQLVGHGHEVVWREIVADDPGAIEGALSTALEKDLDILIFTGGTGIAPRDVTPDVLQARFDRQLPGFGELFRLLSYEEIGPAALLSRAVAGVIGSTAVFCLPGSTAAVRLALDKLIVPELGHIVGELRR